MNSKSEASVVHRPPDSYLPKAYNDFLKIESFCRVVAFRLEFVDIAKGDVIAGILFGQIVYWFLQSKSTGRTRARVIKKNELWVAKSHQEFWQECRLSPKQVKRVITLLANLGLITFKVFKFNGAPTTHVRVNWETLVEKLESVLSQNNESKLIKGTCLSTPKGNMDNDQRGISLTDSTSKILQSNNNQNVSQALNISALSSEIESNAVPSPSPGGFVKPSMQELTEYIQSLGCANPEIKAKEFFDKYESRNWFVGSTKMRSWHKMVDAWKKNWDNPAARSPDAHTTDTASESHQRLLRMVERSKQLRNR